MRTNIVWVNHSTFLIEYKHLSILTDPIFSDRCSPVSFLGPKRYHEPGIYLDDIKSLDAVFISHTHYDHLDYFSIKQIIKKFPSVIFIVPRGFGWWFRMLSAKEIYTCRPGDKLQIQIAGLSLFINALPARHVTNRYIFDLGLVKSLGFIIEFEQIKRIYFVGDSAFDANIAKLASEQSLDLSLIPIGAYLPRFFLRKMHMDPFEAVKFHELTGSKRSIASHWKTFKLTWEQPEQAAIDLQIALEKAKHNTRPFEVVELGEKIAW